MAFPQDDCVVPELAPGVPDVGYATVGYAAGEKALPDVPATWRVRPSGGDDSALLQAALDDLAAQSRAHAHFRGALVLGPGTFRVEGRLRIAASGIVLRGSVPDATSTRIIATGRSRRTLLEIGAGLSPRVAEGTAITAGRVPAGSRTLAVADVAGFVEGDRVVVRRPGTREWIAALGMDQSPGLFADLRTHWQPGSRDLHWHRVITAVDPREKTITLDAPITTTLERRFGGGTVVKVVAGAPISQVGIENLLLESEYDPQNEKDEEHAWIAIALDRVEDAWVRGVTARHFAGSAVRVGAQARRVTVRDCRNERPVSEHGGYRRQSFLVYGQQVLVERCATEAGMNDFAIGFCAAGPNVFRDCEARAALGPSGAFESWAGGVLYQRVRIHGAGLHLTRDDAWTQGAGWTAAHAAVVDSEASDIVVRGAEGAENVVVTKSPPAEKTSADSAEEIAGGAEGPFFVLPPAPATRAVSNPLPRLEIVHGRFVSNGEMVWGGQLNAAWWLGQLSSRAGEDTGVSITRFAPGRDGTGLTEDLPELAARMRRDGLRFYSGGPGLWYDRRRDDHSTAMRPDGRVWAPFYEMPWARSGRGRAWDGLSRYDLTRFNPWYFERTRAFARLCAEHGLVFYHHLYNTHNVLESPSHWVDFPWRPANCLQDTGLPDHPPTDAHGSIHLADAFYNVDHVDRRALHQAHIRHQLEQLGDSSHVVFSLAFQFAGPLAFQEFFLDTVGAWERETGRRVKIALATSRDITEAILADPVRGGQIAVLDLRYWQTQPDGTVWAPRGDRNRAFREMTGEQFGPSYGDLPPPTTPARVYRQVRDYRDRFPEKAIVAWHGGAGPVPVFMAGGAQALLRNPASGQSQGLESDQTPFDVFVRGHLAENAMNLLPHDGWLTDPARHACLADEGGRMLLLYSPDGDRITLAQKLPAAAYTGLWFNPLNGDTLPAKEARSWNAGDSVVKPTPENWLLLLRAAA